MDAYSITWYRFLVAAVVLGLVVKRQGGYGQIRGVSRGGWVLVLITIAGLCGNYIIYLLGLDRITPSAAQVVIQLAPVFLLLGGMVIFGERFQLIQWIGVAVLGAGLMLFFGGKLGQLFDGMGTETAGVLLIIGSGLAWAIYALAQKQLLRELPSTSIMLLIYAAGAILFFPHAVPSLVLDFGGLQYSLLVFCALNTVFAYGCFSEALNHLEASRVGVILAITPLVTVMATLLGAPLFPALFFNDHLSLLSIAGALLVVAGSALSSLSRPIARNS
jgi:drug/metabolite transporter (DMT)-like permease